MHGVLVDRDAVHVVRALGEVAPGVAVRASPGRCADEQPDRSPSSPVRQPAMTGSRRPAPRAPTLDWRSSDRRENSTSAACGGGVAPPRRRAPASTISSASARLGQPVLRRLGRGRRGVARVSSTGRSENVSSCAATSSSAICIQCWRNWYGLVLAASSHTRAPVVLPSFDPSAAVSSGHEKAWTCSPRLAPDQVDAGDDVAPLVGSADLDRAAEVVVQPQVVVGLQQHVAELGERDAVLGVDPHLDALAGEHLVDRDVLADVAQELEDRDRLRPVAVVDEFAPARRRFRRVPRSTIRPSCSLMQATLWSSTSSSSRLRSSERPLGSPTMPVAPPARAIGRWPASWKRRSVTSPIRLPTCRLSAVGSHP